MESRNLRVNMDIYLRHRLEQYCWKTKITMAKFIRDLVTKRLDEEEKKEES